MELGDGTWQQRGRVPALRRGRQNQPPHAAFVVLVTSANWLTNPLGNALKFTDAGEVRVSARRSPTPGMAVTLMISDTGIGIAPAFGGLAKLALAGSAWRPDREATPANP